MNEINNLKLGETAFLPSKIEIAIASIDSPFFKGDNGKRIERNHTVKVTDNSNNIHFLKVHRIIGSDFLVLTRKMVKPKLNFIDRLKLAYKLALRQSL
ncbi:MAG: hypothetical protein ACPGJV_11685 [Bacteriovoracaceae bacterium]